MKDMKKDFERSYKKVAAAEEEFELLEEATELEQLELSEESKNSRKKKKKGERTNSPKSNGNGKKK